MSDSRPGPSAASAVHPGLDPTGIPGHLAIIMDGNGRWAESRGLSRAEGHRAGVAAARRTIEACRDYGIATLTLYAFSTENWRRPSDEVEALMRLLGDAVTEEAEELIRGGVQLRVSGDLSSLEPSLQQQISQVVDLTRGNRTLILNVAYNYGGRAEILTAVRGMLDDVAAGRLRADSVDETAFGRYLYTAGLPDPDLLIRTGGEQRVSNFLLWQIAYTELYFCDIYWPDFDRSHLAEAIGAYQRRKRRFGAVDG